MEVCIFIFNFGVIIFMFFTIQRENALEARIKHLELEAERGLAVLLTKIKEAK